jgi:hypothetical protein
MSFVFVKRLGSEASIMVEFTLILSLGMNNDLLKRVREILITRQATELC